MEVTNKSNDYYFDPTPLLKSNPVPILFIPFNNEKNKCYNCGDIYSLTLLFKQKYCKACLLVYVKNINTTENNRYLDILIYTNDYRCIKHETTRNINFCTRYIQEWCENCSEISRIENYYHHDNIKKYMFTEEYCKLCGKLTSFWFKMCPDCYLISSGWVKSTLFEKSIPILYLPWWDASNKSSVCFHNLKFITDCQKWCSHCFIIYSGCRYCLTTNIIFGITDKTQCKKCKRISNIDIDITNISSGNHNIDEFLVSTRTNIDNHEKVANYMNNMYRSFDPLNVYSFIEQELKNIGSKRIMEWIPYFQIKNLEEIAKGGFGTIYKATWFKTHVAVKKFLKSRDISNFLNEVKSLHRCYDTIFIVKYYGITQDPQIKDYMLIMEYAGGGNLHNYLKKNFTNIRWATKLTILCQISDGLKTIHSENFIHRDFHSGNILSLKNDHKKWVIGDLGLSQPADNSSNNEIYGVIPYVAPELFQGGVFSKESDIYSLGMVMWELTTGCKPFSKVEHNAALILRIIDGKRPVITNDTPECYSNLIKRCWNSDPSKRPSIIEIKETADDLYKMCKKGSAIFSKAEKNRLELILSKQIGPELVEKQHPSAIYTSRPLNSLISQVSSVNSSSTISRQVYYSEEYKFDIDNTRSKLGLGISESLKTSFINLSSISSLNTDGYTSADLDFDIEMNTQKSMLSVSSTTRNTLNIQHPDVIYTSRPLSALISNIKNNIKN